LYLIEILHQTTTDIASSTPTRGCILLKFYIKPQLPILLYRHMAGCILLKFYIKPQHRFDRSFLFCVVSYWNSTSNHNRRFACQESFELYLIEILHQTTTTEAVTTSDS